MSSFPSDLARQTQAQTQDLLTIRHLRKSFAAQCLFEIHDFTLNSASAYVLTGMNGAGKSTLLRILAGLETSEIAEISFLQQNYTLMPYPAALRQKIVYVHQHPILFSTSLFDNLAYGLRARHCPKAQITEQVEAAIAWAGLQHLRKQHPAHFSGGEKQLVALARAKVLHPQLLLLDEPSANLDGRAREQVIALIPDLCHAGASVIMACHDKDLIQLANVSRIKLRDGKLQMR